MTNVSIQQALRFVADNPIPLSDVTIDTPTHELVCRNLFDIANNPDSQVRGGLSRSTKAQKLILDRMVGTRRPGTHPATLKRNEVTFVDLTARIIEEAPDGKQ